MVLYRSNIVHKRVEELQNTHLLNGNRIEVLVLEVILMEINGYLAMYTNNKR